MRGWLEVANLRPFPDGGSTPFLRRNAWQNHLPFVACRDLPWEILDASLGRFDLIIGSDILYERGHAELLAAMVFQHAGEHAEILITDPGRGNSARFSKALALHGFAVDDKLSRFTTTTTTTIPPFRGRLLSYRRATAVSALSVPSV